MGHVYDATSIKVLKGLDGVRQLPAMYIGSVDSQGIFQIVKEAVDNSIDEAMAGHATEITLTINTDVPEITVTDNGRGIPPEKHAETGVSAITTVLTTLHAGGKFDKDSYKTSAGLHGVGVSCTNAVSEKFVVNVKRGNRVYHQEFKKGVPTTPDVIELKKVPPELDGYQSGTSVFFTPDYSIFDKKAGIDPKVLREYLQNLSYLCKGVAIYLTVDNGEQETYKSEEGLKELLLHNLPKDTELLHEAPFCIESEHYDITLCWTTDTETENIWSFVNSVMTPDGGTHVTGLRKAVSKAVIDRSKKSVYNDDVRVGIFAAIHTRLTKPVFQGQTKTKLLNTEVTSEVYELVLEQLGEFLNDNPRLVEIIVDRAVQLSGARDAMKKQKQALKNVSSSLVHKNKRGVLPGKLAEAPRCAPADRELFIVEGDSAFGTVKVARDSNFQEAFPLRGKVPNASRTIMTALFKNTEILDIITAVGAGAGDDCDVKKARVGKVLLLADADPDGHHISALLISFFVSYMYPLVEAEMLYVVRSPLFKTSYKDVVYFGDSLEEVRAKLPKNAAPFITRIKGHGEVGPKTLREYATDPTTRKLYKVLVDGQQVKLVEQVMGADSGFRKIILGIE